MRTDTKELIEWLNNNGIKAVGAKRRSLTHSSWYTVFSSEIYTVDYINSILDRINKRTRLIQTGSGYRHGAKCIFNVLDK